MTSAAQPGHDEDDEADERGLLDRDEPRPHEREGEIRCGLTLRIATARARRSARVTPARRSGAPGAAPHDAAIHPPDPDQPMARSAGLSSAPGPTPRGFLTLAVRCD